jgi:hypothetical protein
MDYTPKQRARFVIVFIKKGNDYTALKSQIGREKKWMQDFKCDKIYFQNSF